MAFLKTNEKKQLSMGGIKRIIPYIHRTGQMVLNILLPPKCLKCGSRVVDAHNICPDCWKDLYFISDPKCACCGFPFGSDLGNDYSVLGETFCAACQKSPHSFDKANAALRYDDESRSMILGFKHQDRTEYTQYFTKLLYQAGYDFWHDANVLVPVPLHKKRLISRRYNQSALLSESLARKTGLFHYPEALERIKNTPPQQGNLKKRSQNVKGVFKATLGVELKDKNIVLVDDVYTTGSTADNCAKALKKAGAKKVYLLTVFRVISPVTAK